MKLERSEHVRLTHDEVLLAFVLDLCAGILTVEDYVARLEDHLFVLGASTYGDDFATQGLLLS